MARNTTKKATADPAAASGLTVEILVARIADTAQRIDTAVTALLDDTDLSDDKAAYAARCDVHDALEALRAIAT